jgi:hypothetical protein
MCFFQQAELETYESHMHGSGRVSDAGCFLRPCAGIKSFSVSNFSPSFLLFELKYYMHGLVVDRSPRQLHRQTIFLAWFRLASRDY